MCLEEERERILAVERYRAGGSGSAVCAALGHSRKWLYKWVARHDIGTEDWYKDKNRCPYFFPGRTAREIEELVRLTRLHLYSAGEFCGPEAIRWRLEEEGAAPLPSVSTIKRILRRHDLTHKRTGRYEPKGKAYPKLAATNPNDVHEYDFVGPCYLAGPIKFHSLNALDLMTRRCGVEAMTTKTETVEAIWKLWCRLGIPKYAQVDNEMVFFGSPAHPRGMGQFIRLCCFYGVEAVFIPMREPWRNGAVEKFNEHWLYKFYRRVRMDGMEDLRIESQEFETRHNSRYHYSPLGGRTPLQALAASGTKPLFPAKLPARTFSKPQQGRYHVVRFIRSDGQLDVFGERFPMPAKAVYEYVTATIDVERERMSLHVCGERIGEMEYRLR
ncbi:MAG: helix-turn-helix domain-containing protein [Patescibacteria group bacterium]